MIHLHDVSWQTKSWQWQLANAIRDPEVLLSMLDIDIPFAENSFPVLVPLPYLSRIQPGYPQDPLLRQVFPFSEENDIPPGYLVDPLDESKYSPLGGLLHKYAGRALIVSTGQCAINCRYCFRRHFPYRDFQPDTRQWQHIYGYLQNDQTIKEVILSGGDPLSLSDSRLKTLITELSKLKQLKVLRIHTRLPVVIPQRICPELLDWVKNASIKIVMVLHVNHANEIDDEVSQSIQQLADSGVHLLNQAVLLKGVNDSAEAIVKLSWRLFDIGVQPYYLHLMDKVKNASHFDLSTEVASSMMETVQDQLPGYLVPKLVTEEPGRLSKTLIR